MFTDKLWSEAVNSQPQAVVRLEYLDKYGGGGLWAFLPPDTLPSEISRNALDYIGFPYGTTIRFSVTNVSNNTIILNKELPIKIANYQSYPFNVDVLALGGGGGGVERNFLAEFHDPKNTSLVKATYLVGTGIVTRTLDELSNEEVVDFFSLTPGEVEVFKVGLNFEDAGLYEIQPGIEYFKNGTLIPVWLEAPTKIILPENITVWRMPDSLSVNNYILQGKCRYTFPNNDSNYFRSVYTCDN